MHIILLAFIILNIIWNRLFLSETNSKLELFVSLLGGSDFQITIAKDV